MAKALGKNLFLTFIISSVLTFLAIRIYYSKEAGSLEGNQGIFIMILASLFWILILSILSLTVFLNLHDKVRKNLLLSILTFYLLPLIATILFYCTSEIKDMWGSFFILTGFYFFIQTCFFIKFRKIDLKTL